MITLRKLVCFLFLVFILPNIEVHGCDFERLGDNLLSAIPKKNLCFWTLVEVSFGANGLYPILVMSERGGKASERLAEVSRDQDLSVRDSNGDTLLHSAIRNENLPAVVDYSVTPSICDPQYNELTNIKNNDGDTPMHLAAQKASPEYAMLVYRYGGVIETRNLKGETPIDIALRHRLFRTLKFLENPKKEMLPVDKLISYFVPIHLDAPISISYKKTGKFCPI